MNPAPVSFLAFAAVGGGVLLAGLIAEKRRLPRLLAGAHGLAGFGTIVFLLALNVGGRERDPSHGVADPTGVCGRLRRRVAAVPGCSSGNVPRSA